MTPLEQLQSPELLALGRLRALGLDALVALPQLVVVGDTSSGKSSLLSALSGIGFPSSSALTTRCPVRVTLRNGDAVEGSARVLRASPAPRSSSSASLSTSSRSTSTTSSTLTTAAAADEVEPEPADLPADGECFPIHKLEDIPGLVERLSSRAVRPGQVIGEDEVAVDVQGPALPLLALTDLPGLVRAVADGEDPRVIPRVRRMVDAYMRSEHAVILAVVPANVDVHNAEILQAAQAADPEGRRTLAVVTKLDLVDEGAEGGVLELVRNRRKALALGYHAVKCRSEREVRDGVSIADALRTERAFFREHPHWSRIPAANRGTAALAERVAEVLQDTVRRSLPRVLADMERLVASAEAELERLGGPRSAQDAAPSAQRRRFLALVHQYCRRMEAAMDGSCDFQWRAEGAVDLRLRAVLRLRDAEFQRAVEAQTAAATMLEEDEEDEEEAEEEEGDGRDQADDNQPQCRVAEGDWVQTRGPSGWTDCRVVETRGTDVKCAEFPGEWLGASRWRFPARAQTRRLRLRQLIRDNRGDELAIFPSYRVFSVCVQRAVQAWAAPAMALVEAYVRQTRAVSDHWVASLDASSAVKSHLSAVALRVLSRSADAAARQVSAQLQRESRPYTQDKRLYEDFDARRRRALSAQLGGLLAASASSSADGSGAASSVSVADAMRAFSTVFASSEEREALEIDMALRAYLRVAVRRFVDVVPMKLNDLVLAAFVADVQRELVEATSDEQMARLMQEPPQRAQLRRQLMERLERLREAKREVLGESRAES